MKTKVSKTAFEENALPKNRKELFSDIVKNHWRTLLLLGLFLFLGALPFMACLFIRDHASLSYSMAYSRGEIDEITRENLVRTVHFYASIGEAVSLFIFSIPLAGVLRILRQFIWLEPIFFKEDFHEGLKDNYWHCLVTSFFCGLLIVGIKAMMFTVFNNVYLLGIIIGFFIIFVLPPMFYSIAQGTLYSGTYRSFHKNGVALYFKHALQTLPFVFLLVSPFLLEIIQNSMAVKYILMAIIVYGLPIFALLGFMLFSYSLFDVYINKEQFPEIYQKGLYQAKKEDKSKE